MAINFKRYKKTGVKSGNGGTKGLYTDEVVKEAVELVWSGVSYAEIMKKYGITAKSTLSDWVNGRHRKDATGGSLYDREIEEDTE